MPVASGAVDPRLEVRSNVFLTATLVTDQAPKSVRLRNISRRGALIDGIGIPGPGTSVALLRGSLRVSGKIAWQQQEVCGLRFENEVVVEDWVRRVEHRGQDRVDEIVSLIRQRTIEGASFALQAQQESLGNLSADLTAFCEALAGKPDLVAKYPSELLQLDAIAQRLNQYTKAA
jgi:hypothetical protein